MNSLQVLFYLEEVKNLFAISKTKRKGNGKLLTKDFAKICMF